MLLRLAPSALVVLIFVGFATVLLSPQTTWTQTGRELIASALYYENWELISSQLAYGAAGPSTSPLQHFWSLSVQGQFFLLWPIVITLIALVLRRRDWNVVPMITCVTLALSVASFAYAVQANATNPDAAYLDSFARFWELGAGALVAILIRRLPLFPLLLRITLGWCGLVVIIASGFVVDGARAYPGPLALVPVTGACLILLSAGAPTRFGADRLLALRPMQFLARISYPLYLWHWPILWTYLVFRGYTAVGLSGGAAVFAVSVGVAWLHSRSFERPVARIREHATPRRTIMGTVAAIATVAITTACSVAAHTTEVDRQAAVAEQLGSDAVDCLGAASLDPALAPCNNPDLDGRLVPGVAALEKDDANRSECWGVSGSEANFCTVGPPTGYSKHLIAVGDSHNNTLLDVYEQIAETHNWRIDVAGLGRCYWTKANLAQPDKESVQRCKRWNESVERRISSTTDLDAVIVTHSARAAIADVEGADADRAEVEGLVAAWSKARPDTRIIALRDHPIFGHEVIACISRHGLAASEECSAPRDHVLLEDGHREAVAAHDQARLIDLTSFYCTQARCAPVIGNTIVTRDGLHLTRAFARTLIPYFDREITALLE
ncbi:acyltransferase family protein [Agromyces humatus]|uniref:Acyltransferase family protein n=2 Tax=Agromyces humatus TaxID=279573 RepID=A0ABN2K6I7_9MICO